MNKSFATTIFLSLALSFPVGIGLDTVSQNQAHAADLSELFGSAVDSSGNEKILRVDQAFSVEPVQNGNTVTVTLNITPKHYLYKDKFKLNLPAGVTATPFKFSHSAESINDPTFGNVKVFRQPKVIATTTLTNNSSSQVNENITLRWQGCADAGLCYPPQSETVSINLSPSDAVKTSSNSSAATSTTGNKVQNANQQSNDSLVNDRLRQTTQTAVNNNQKSTSLTQDASDNNQTSDTAQSNDISASNSDNAIQDSSKYSQGTDLNSDSGSISGSNLGNDNADTFGLNENEKSYDDNRKLINSNANLSQEDHSESVNDDAVSGLALNAESLDDQDPFGLAEHPWLAMLLLFLAGLGLSFTACVLPMLPIVSNIVARQHAPTAKKGFLLSGSYALGVAVAYGLLGAVIAIFGQQLGIIGWLQNPVILLMFAALFVVLALYMLEVISVPIPNAIRQKTAQLSQKGDKFLGSTFGSFVAGLLSALVVSPCVSPPLFGALLAVSTIGNPLLGFAALFMLGFGLSTPLILLGTGQGNFMPKAGEWMIWVKQGFALLLLGVSLLLVERVLISPFMLVMWSIWFMVVAVWAWRWRGRGDVLTKAMAMLLAIWSAITLIGAAGGSKDNWQPLKVFEKSELSTSIASNQNLNQSAMLNADSAANGSDIHIDTLDALIPVIEQHPKVLIDVTADWCIECRIMDKTLFSNRPESMSQWQFVRLDVTETNEDSNKILTELQLFGPPALLYIIDGKLEKRQIGEISRKEFEQTLMQF